MIKISLTFVALIICANASANTQCETIQNKSEKEQVYLDKSKNIFEVVSKGRLHFNNAPSKECKVKSLFLVPGDKVIGYSEYNGFTSVAYFKENGDSVDGWLDTSQLKNTGLSNGPSGEEQMVFNMLPEIIAKNKLTSLPNKCLNFNLNDKDEKYYTTVVSRANGKECINNDVLPFTILVKRNTLEVYSNQGHASDEFRSLEPASSK